MDNNEQVKVVESVDVLQALNRSEIDLQIATAKAYPRDLERVSENIQAMAMFDKETMEACSYALERQDKEGNTKIIEGPSVRLAEICVSQWGNLRAGKRIISNDGRRITAQGICFDLENNVAVTIEVQRRITTNKGFTYSDDMQVLTGNAAASIAFRNAVFSVIPKVVVTKVLKEIKNKMLADAQADLAGKRQEVVAWFAAKTVTEAELCAYLGIRGVGDMTAEHIVKMRGVATAIGEGVTTVEATFRPQAAEAAPTADEKKETLRAAKTAAKTSGKGNAAPTLL